MKRKKEEATRRELGKPLMYEAMQIMTSSIEEQKEAHVENENYLFYLKST
jgi:hypothetical protein